MAQHQVPNNAEQFKQSFREEAREILTELESALLELNENPSDRELVSRIFRGLHTIKGSGAMFGFEKLASFTHNLETAFDEVRTGRLQISAELIDLTLGALDQIRALLEEDTAGAPPADPVACAEILEQVRRLAGIAPSGGKEAAHEPAACAAAHAAANVSGPMRDWHISFAPGPDLLRCGANPLLLLRELRRNGRPVGACRHGGDPAPQRTGPGALLHRVGSRAAHRGGLGRHPRCVHLCRGQLRADDRGGRRSSPSAAQTVPPSDAERTARALEESRSVAPGRRSYDKPDNASSLRVPAAKLDQFVDLVGELVTVQARLSELSSQREDAEVTAVS